MENHGSKGLPPQEIIKRIEKALVLGGSTHTWEDVRFALLEGKMQIFWNDFGACITEICVTPQLRYLNCFVVAGKLPEVMELHDQVENHALSAGCAYMITSARKGWKTVLPKFGWKDTRSVFVRDLQGVKYG